MSASMKAAWILMSLMVTVFIIFSTFRLYWNMYGDTRNILPYKYNYNAKMVGANFSSQRNSSKTTHSTHDTQIASNCKNLRQLKNILLAVNYDWPRYSSIPLLKKTYEGIFGHLVFCGSSDHPEIVKTRGLKGYLGYDCLATAIRKFPHFIGYLQINDDVILNWWNLMKFDLSKIWTSSSISYKATSGNYIFGKSIPEGWHWWKSEDAARRCEAAFNQISHLSNTTEGRRLNLPRYLKNYLRNTENKYMCIKGWSDVFYIPQEFSSIYSNISNIYRDNRVFLEVAVPTILLFFINRTNLMNLHGVFFVNTYGYSAKYLSGEAFYEVYSLKSTFTHPFKLDGKMKSANRNFLENVFKAYGNIVQRYCLNL